LLGIVSVVKKELPPKRETTHRKRLGKIKALAGKLSSSLADLDSYELSQLCNGMNLGDEEMDSFRERVSKLGKSVRYYEKSEIPNILSTDHAAGILVLGLCAVWRDLKGVRPGYSTDPVTDKRYGKFVELTRSCCELASVGISDETIVNHIDDWRKRNEV
jgi:hypothetical protein